MKANELRIGNMLHFPFTNEKVEVLGVNAHVENFKIINSISFKKESNLYCEKISVLKPIPLTEEWLLKFGFEKKENGLFTKKIEYIYNSLKYCDDYKIWIYYNDDNDAACNAIADLKYVHELQNLYHCLCGKELQINTTKTTK